MSFRREKFVPKGGPDGGDGGRGGNVILRADQHVGNLTALFYEPIVKAKNGSHGMGKKMTGRAGADKIVHVPLGTIVWKDEGEGMKDEIGGERRTPNIEHPTSNAAQSAIGNRQSAIQLVVDLMRDGQEFVLCRGGAGGKGNVHFKSSRNRAPREYTEGEEGSRAHFLLELRTIADAGLVGYPNAGKSSLLRKMSAARPKVAAYPFTTLHPIIGVVEFGGYKRATVADIPGLIEGAHRNVGLGHDFLRHIMRCRVLLFIVDLAGTEGRNPIDDLQHLRREIALYDAILSEKPWHIVANKLDLPTASENLPALRKRFAPVELVAVSAKTGEGLNELETNLERWLAISELKPAQT